MVINIIKNTDMKKMTLIAAFLFPAIALLASAPFPPDTTFLYNGRKIVVEDIDNGVNISIYRRDAEGLAIQDEKIYEGIFTEDQTIERRYENTFEISIPDIFKPKNKRNNKEYHWPGFGIGFANVPQRLNYDGELSSIVNVSRSLQYNFNFMSGSWQMAQGNLRGIIGMGLQFNAIHFQHNKALEVQDFKTVITSTEAGKEYNDTRLHYTYLTFPLLFEKSCPVGNHSFLFFNAGIVGKVKTASSSKIWYNNDNGDKAKKKMPGDLNLRPVTFDFLVQMGMNNWGIFASYAPLDIFMENKGPKGKQTAIGLQFYF